MDVKGKRVGACKAQYISHSCVLSLKSEHEKNDIFLLRGNISKQGLNPVTERFRCQWLARSQVRCQGFTSGRFRCFMKKSRLCGQVGY